MEKLLALPTAALVAIGVLVVVQLSLQVYAIVDLVRLPAERLTLPKWAWAAIVVLGEILGPIIYLVAGRKPAPAVEVAPSAPAATRAESAADALYGRRGDADQR
jgi:hypothetical protein